MSDFKVNLAVLLLYLSTASGFGTTVLITVEDEKHRPVRDAMVWVVPCDRYGAFLTSPQLFLTDERGQVRFNADLLMSSPWEATHLTLWAIKDKFQSLPKTWSKRPVYGKFEQTSLRLILRPAVIKPLKVSVRDSHGQPAVGVNVFLWRILSSGVLSPLIGAWTTNSSGTVQTSFQLPLILERTATLYGTSLHFFVLAYHPTNGWASAVTDTKGLSNLNLTLLPHERASLKVQDCFGKSLKGLRGRVVAVQMPNIPFLIPLPASHFSFVTDQLGEVTFPVPKNGKGLWEWSRQAPWGLKVEAKEVWLNASAVKVIKFHHKTIRVMGRLLNAQTGKPLDGESVLLSVRDPTSTAPLLTFCAKTDEKWQFVIQSKPFLYTPTSVLLGFPDGRWLLLLGSPKATLFQPPFPLFKCQEWVVADVALDPPDAKVFGIVVDGQGKPVSFAFVEGLCLKLQQTPKGVLVEATGKACDGSYWEVSKQLTGEGVSPFAYTFADQQGQFQLELRAGIWKLSALKVGPPHRPPKRIPKEATFLLSLGIGYLPSTRKTDEVTLKIPKGSNIKVTLTVTGWANF